MPFSSLDFCCFGMARRFWFSGMRSGLNSRIQSNSVIWRATGGAPTPLPSMRCSHAPARTIYARGFRMSSTEPNIRNAVVSLAIAVGLDAYELTAIEDLLHHCLLRRSLLSVPPCPAEELLQIARARCTSSISRGPSFDPSAEEHCPTNEGQTRIGSVLAA